MISAQRGLFISFEGGDGAGKSSQIGRLADHLRRKGMTVRVTREPGGSNGAEAQEARRRRGAHHDAVVAALAEHRCVLRPAALREQPRRRAPSPDDCEHLLIERHQQVARPQLPQLHAVALGGGAHLGAVT